MVDIVLEAWKLNAHYGRAHILFDITIGVRRGEVVALIGRNGAGKSTTLKTLMGLVPVTGGTVRFEDEEIEGLSPYEIARLGIGYVPEDRRVFSDLTVEENLEVGRRAFPGVDARWTPQRLYQLFPSLGGMRTRRASQMSGGEQQMLTIARTLMGNPGMLLLDEPSEGLAPLVVQQMAETISRLKGEGLSILLCEQNLHFAHTVSDRAYVIESGQIRYQGTMDELYHNTDVRRAYLTV